MVTTLGNVTVVVKDLSRSLRFFRDKIGLRLAFYDKKHKWVCFDAGRMAFSLTTPWNAAAKKMVGRRTGLSFYVDDIEKTVKALIAIAHPDFREGLEKAARERKLI